MAAVSVKRSILVADLLAFVLATSPLRTNKLTSKQEPSTAK